MTENQKADIKLLLSEFSYLVSRNSAFAYQNGKHYMWAERIMLEQIEAVITGKGFTGVAAFDELKNKN